MRREEKDTKKKSNYFFADGEAQSTLPYFENILFEIKNASKETLIINEFNEIINGKNKIKENQSKKIKNYINDNNLNRYYIIIIINVFIIIYLLCKIKCNIYDALLFQFSSKITLKVKGIGDSALFNNSNNLKNHLQDVCINGIHQDNIHYIYNLNQSDNLIELIFDDNITDCINMFYGCKNITGIDLSNFNTSQVQYMQSMFRDCSSLTSLNLLNINTSQVVNMYFMFSGCSSVTSLDITYFDTSKVFDLGCMFRDCTSLISLDLSNFNTSQVTYMDFMFSNCSSLISLDLSNFNTSKVTYMDFMFSNCSSLTTLNLSNFNTSQVTHMDFMFSDCHNLEHINLKNFNDNKLYSYENMLNNVPNNIIICINENITNQKIYLQIMLKTNCIIECSENLNISERKNTGINEIEYYDNILKLIENIFKENYDTSILDKGQDENIKTDKITITFSTVQNQKNNLKQNITTIDLGECENLLRDYYNISNNLTLYMKKIEVPQEGMNISKIEYDVYCKLFGINLIKLNLTACENSKISIFIPIELTENLDKYNSSSNYYNDICYTTTSEDGTDMILKDRQKDFIDKNKIVCQDDCEFSKYDNENKKAECSCKVKESSSSIADMKINKAKLLENFINIKSFVNFNFLICYKNLFNRKGILNNIGSYIILSIIIFHIITIIMFYFSQFRLVKDEIKKIIYAKANYQIFVNSKEKNKSRK